MTDPLMPALCHKTSDTWIKFYDVILEINSPVYNNICLISSFCGILGSLYQVLPRISFTKGQYWNWSSAQRSGHTIFWLAVSDFFASFGIFSRSLLKFISPSVLQSIRSHRFGCYFVSFWIQYFYMVTWFWTLIYAVDICLALHEKQSYPKIYHSISWLFPAVLTFTGIYLLYVPEQNYPFGIKDSFWKFFPNYLLSYIPLLMVMIINPILYYISSKSVHILVAQYLCQYTNRERRIVDMIKIKFSLINLTFYACWLPNIVNSIIIFASWDHFQIRAVVSLWYIMAIMNPLQALFNCLIYQRPADETWKFWKSWRKQSHGLSEFGERNPLLSRKSGSSNDTDEPDFLF